MSLALKVAIIAAHFLVYIVVAANIWIFSRRSNFFQSKLKLRSLPFIYYGYVCFAIATTYEIAEHIEDFWFYESQISTLNRLFYTFTTAGLCFIAMGLRKSKFLDIILIACMVSVPLAYGVQDSKSLMQGISLLPAIIFVYTWYVVMHDWRVFLYFLFSNVIALGFGIALIATGQQALHIFIGPASAFGLMILGYIAWIQPQKYSDRQAH